MAKRPPRLLLPLLCFSLLSLLFLLSFSTHSSPRPRAFRPVLGLADAPHPPPRLAYLISGSDGDGPRVLRLLLAIFHPRNRYLLHLDLRASQRQRTGLAAAVRAVEAFHAAGNVDVIGRAGYANRGGSTPLATLLHGAAVFLRLGGDWDWFVNLDASDYPLITQDDFLHVLSYVPRDLSFIQHASNVDQKEYQRVLPIIVDPGLYLAARRNIFVGSKKRVLPTAYKLFTGSPYMILSRKLVEYSILGWDNLPRILLMYFSNMKSSHQSYFHTLACNANEFKDKILNSDLRFMEWDDPAGEEPWNHRVWDFNKMMESGAVFGRSFQVDDPVLDKIDEAVLQRGHGRITPGGWCIDAQSQGGDPCLIWGDPNVLRPGPSSRRFEQFLLKLLANISFVSN